MACFKTLALAVLALALVLCARGTLGVFLPKLCESAQEGNARRGLMADIRSSGFVAPGPVHPVKYTIAPIVSPSLAPC
ncbi:hypothetical protein GH714_027557 [Hevea brasiliensis]|uniref:Uncharacterized protein n=1 Tax=Hevea brasiliensis TaxID=3981 RepID=A0A6A6N4V5_HEVBR|nr:hypothetical protein GH714_027557 [Hevea brasiliensis]